MRDGTKNGLSGNIESAGDKEQKIPGRSSATPHQTDCGEDNTLDSKLEFLQRLVDSLPDATLTVGADGKVLVWNRAMEDMTGVKAEEVLGRGDYVYAVPFFGERRPILVDIALGKGNSWTESYEKLTRKGHIVVGEGFAPHAREGKGLYFWTLAAPIYGDDGRVLGAVQCIRDIGERKLMEEELKRLSTRDALTGLYNRNFFEEQLLCLERGRFYPVSLIICDLDGLKLVNDAWGHDRGDELLRRAASVIKGCVRASDIVARVGGDEFAVILPGADKKTAEKVMRRIKMAVDTDNTKHSDFPLSISVGSATAEDGSRPLRQLYKEADDAMYLNKLANGRDLRAATISALKTALAGKDFHNMERMKELACSLGNAVGLCQEEMDSLRLLVEMHDVGKLGVPDDVLCKPGPLTEEEMKVVQRHPETGYRIALSSGELARIAPYILQHHERWDGTGYPQRLAGENIHLLSRILSIVDAYDAMTCQRPYRPALTHQEALNNLKQGAGTQFDPRLVSIFLTLVPEGED